MPPRGMIGAACAFALAAQLAPAVARSQEAPRAPGDEPVFTLEQAIEAVLRHSPLIAQATGAVRNAESAERRALGQFLPSLSLSSGASLASTERFNPQTNTTVTGSNDSYSAGISSQMTIFSGGQRGAALAEARAQTAAADAALIEQRYAVVLTVKQTFFDVLRAEDLIRVAEARVQRAQEALDAATRRADVGSGTRSDVLRARLELTNARQSLLQAQNQRRTAAHALGRLVGVDGAVGARHDAPLEPRPLALGREELLALALEQAPAVRAADAGAAAADAAARAAKAQYFPSVTASGGYDWFNQDPAIGGGRTSWSLRLGVSFPLFNRFQREDAVSRASVQADIARSQAADARRRTRAELERILGALELAEQQIALAQEAVRAAEEDFRVQQERYRLGVSTILDQVTSQLNLVQAETDLIAARYDYQVARAELEALVGRNL
ncbi:MAG TPA: TolC family protein [Longimicrobiales bacterium]